MKSYAARRVDMENKTLKVGIISGTISSLLVIIFIQPILNFVWKLTIAIAGSIHQGSVDRIYRAAAAGDTNLIGQATFLFLTLFVGFVVGNLTGTSEAYTEISERRVRLLRFIKWVSTVTGLLLIILVLVSFAVATGITETNASFTQRLTILAPAISDAEYKMLKAEWASMRTKADYAAVVATMNKRARELNIILPPAK